MGCCYSKNEDPSSSPSQNPPPVPPAMADSSDISRLDPPLHPQPEEETVKEVLSETPTQRKPQPFPKMEQPEKVQKVLPLSPILPSFPKLGNPHVEFLKKKNNNIDKEVPFCVTPPEISEISSEICSLSESYSTTTVTERREEEDDGRSRDYGEVRQQRVHSNRSPAKVHRKWSNPGEFDRERRSPVRRSEPSPGRRNDNGPRSIYTSDVAQNGRRRVAGNNRSWRDPGESSGRRSRSPSTRSANSTGSANPGLGRSPSARKTNRSPARGPPLMPENARRLDEKEEEEEENVPANESLENPLVSLECFIFL